MQRPTNKELLYASHNGGQLPKSYFERTGVKADKVDPKPRGVEIILPDGAPTEESTKAEIIAYLEDNEIAHDPRSKKSDLLGLI